MCMCMCVHAAHDTIYIVFDCEEYLCDRTQSMKKEEDGNKNKEANV